MSTNPINSVPLSPQTNSSLCNSLENQADPNSVRITKVATATIKNQSLKNCSQLLLNSNVTPFCRLDSQNLSITYDNGDTYVGGWADGKENGQGTFTRANGVKYVGAWKNGQRHGQGTWRSSGGVKYEGEWADDRIHGQGTLIYSNGDKYVGGWANGQRHGQGTFTYSNGDKYVGGWANDQRHGQGKLTQATGTEYNGDWENGQRHGQGAITSQTLGVRIEGTFANGLANGLATSINLFTGQRTRTIWQDNELIYRADTRGDLFLLWLRTLFFSVGQ